MTRSEAASFASYRDRELETKKKGLKRKKVKLFRFHFKFISLFWHLHAIKSICAIAFFHFFARHVTGDFKAYFRYKFLRWIVIFDSKDFDAKQVWFSNALSSLTNGFNCRRHIMSISDSALQIWLVEPSAFPATQSLFFSCRSAPADSHYTLNTFHLQRTSSKLGKNGKTIYRE